VFKEIVNVFEQLSQWVDEFVAQGRDSGCLGQAVVVNTP
jgi:hypothetical protein